MAGVPASETTEVTDVDEVLDAVVARMGGARREGQHEMARAVAAALDGDEHLMVQAGTGTGKSLAYLVPTLLHAVRSGERAVISTATLALQRQVLGHDLPLVEGVVKEKLPRPPAVALLKGWHNYLCKHKITGGYPPEEDAALFDMAPESSSSAEEHPAAASSRDDSLGGQVVRVRAWADET
uniref:DEAD/DEAH box helicase n=1 Tax=Pseudactinotalea sp. TaxID=1926260 RepID=UPI003B3A37BD